MADIKISEAAGASALLDDDMLPLARSGSAIAYHATALEIQSYTNTTPGAVASSNLLLSTGNASAGDSGDIILRPGTATGNRGNIILDADSIALRGDYIDAGSGLPGVLVTTTGGLQLEVPANTAADSFGLWLNTANHAGGGDPGAGIGTGDNTAGASDTGQIWIWSGDNNGTGNSGPIYIQTGKGTGAGNASGDINIVAGPGASGAARGSVLLDAPNVLLANDPTAALGAATKQYVDAKATGLPLTGGTLTGSLAITPGSLTVPSGSPRAAALFAGLDAILNQQGTLYWNIYRDTSNVMRSLAGGGCAYISANAGIITINNLNSSTAGNAVTPTLTMQISTLGITMNTGATITLTGNPTNNLHAAPKQYVDTAAAPAPNNVGRNQLHNSMFRVQQRGAGPWTANGNYTADRWAMYLSADTVTTNVRAGNDTIRAAIGDEAVTSYLEVAVTGTSGAGAYSFLSQPIENVRRLAGKTVAVSFWAAATSGAPKIGVNMQQNFGTGGSPSAAAWALVTGLSFTLSTTWTRYTGTVALPSASGKTLGTNNNDWCSISFGFSSGATNNAVLGNIGVQSGTFNIWGVQLEVGSIATPLEKPDPRFDLANCQRFFQTGTFYTAGYQGVAANGVGSLQPFPVVMRAVPAMATSGLTQNNCTGSVANPTANGFVPYATSTAIGSLLYAGTFTATADL